MYFQIPSGDLMVGDQLDNDMKKIIDHLSTFVLWATLVIFVVIGGLAGYAAGDELLSSTEFIRPEDIGCSQMCFSFTYTGN